MKATEKEYERSNKIVSVKFTRLSKKEYSDLLSAETIADRQRTAQRLVDYLCEKYGIEPCHVFVKNTPQPSFRNGKKLGQYTTYLNKIVVWNLTAKQKKIVSINVFADTILHEFMHHYDIQFIKLGTTIHCSGFYKRISDLQKKLSA